MPLRLIFMGTPDFAVPTLKALMAAGHEIAAVYTRAAKPGGRRGLDLVPTPVERAARELGLKVATPKTLKDEAAQAEFRAHQADAAVVVAYGLILPKPVLEAPHLGCFNVHASLLPRWRGAAPISRAIMAGDAESGVTIMQMDEGLDTGAMVMAERIAIDAGHDGGRIARRAGAARRRSDGARAGRRGARRALAQAAAGGGRHVCRQDCQGRNSHRLDEAGARGARPHPRPVAVSRRLVRARRRARQGAALDQRRGQRRTRHGA